MTMTVRHRTAGSPGRAPGLGVVAGTALTIVGVLGTGVLVLPALAVRQAGPAALVAVGALLVLSVPLAATFAALGSRHPADGGVSSFVDRALGSRAATVTAWWFYLGVPLGIPALGLFAGDYVQAAVGGGPTTRIATALGLVLLAAAANARGVRISGRVQVLLTAVLVGSLIAVLVLCAPAADLRRLAPFTPHGWAAVAPAALLLVWLLTGWEAVTHLTGRFRSPRRDVPRASAVTLIVVALLFGGLTLVLITVPDSGTTVSAPLTALLATRLSAGGGLIAASLAVVVTLGNANTYLAGLAELGAEMGRTGRGPRWLGGHPSSDVPRRSLTVVTVQALTSLGLVAALGWPTEHLVLVTAASQVAVYAAGLVAALRLLPRRSSGWWAAAVSLPPILVLALLSGWYLLAPAGLAVAALTYRHIADGRRGPGPAGCTARTA
jgi:amino acid efflux transporter